MGFQIKAIKGENPALSGTVDTRGKARTVKEYLDLNGFTVSVEQTRTVDLTVKPKSKVVKKK